MSPPLPGCRRGDRRAMHIGKFAVREAGERARELARSILRYSRERLAPHQWIRRLEFAQLPKTTSGKIRRAELRTLEARRANDDGAERHEFVADGLFDSVESGPVAPGMG